MRLSSLVCFSLLLVLVLIPAGPQLFADEPPAKKPDEKAPDLVPPTAKELADKRMVFMRRRFALHHPGWRPEGGVEGADPACATDGQ